MSALPDNERKAAWASAVVCYLVWGFVPLLMQQIYAQGPGAWEIVAHRVLWGVVAAGVLVLLAKQGRQVVAVFKNPRTLALLFTSSALIAANWGVFTFAVNDGKVLESSLGYYINPLVNMAAGALIFRERIDRIALAAIALAAIGVAVQAFALGRLPWISLALAFSFGGYGIVRKWVKADAQTGLLVECLLLAPFALGYLLFLGEAGHFGETPGATWWLIASGPITAAPLALFAWAARRMPLSAMGFLQFMAPTIGFFTGVLQGEPFKALHAVSFGFIWLAAVVFVIGAVRGGMRAAKEAALEGPVPEAQSKGTV